jgi:hypothetical protein
VNRPYAKLTANRSASGTLRRKTLYVLLCVPFLVLAAAYSALPPELPTLRIWIGRGARFALKSLFTVFRVPLMNLIHGLMAAVMLSLTPAFKNTERRIAYSNTFLALLFAIVLKSNFEAMELSMPAAPAFLHPYTPWFGFGALASVIGGLGLALFHSRKVPLPWPELRLTIRDRLLLAGLFATYLAIVTQSLLSSRQ